MSINSVTTGNIPSENAKSIVFVDSTLPDLNVILANIRSGNRVVLLDSSADALTVITQTILDESGIAAVHIVSHAQSGQLIIGGQRIDASLLNQRVSDVQSWTDHLAPGADILLYGCNVASSDEGLNFIQVLGRLSQTDVAASTDITGSAILGGNWTLEATKGVVEAAAPFSPDLYLNYNYTLTSGIYSATTGTNVDTAGVTSGLIGAGKLITFDPINVTSLDTVAKLVIRAYDVDYGLKNTSGVPYAPGDPNSEWDGVYVQKQGASTWSFVGYLNGTNNNWSYSTFDISSILNSGGAGNYIVRVVPDDNATQTQANNAGRWVVGASIAETFLGNGGALITALSETGQSVTSTVSPNASGNYTIQYLLTDATGRAVAQLNAAANGLLANTAYTSSSTLATNSNFYASWSAVPSGTYVLQATLIDANGVVQDIKSTNYTVVASTTSTSSAKVTISDLKNWFGSTPADLAHQATRDNSSDQIILKGVLASPVPSNASSVKIYIQESTSSGWSYVKSSGGTTSQSSNATSITLSSGASNWEFNLDAAVSNNLTVGTHTYRAKYTYTTGSSGGNNWNNTKTYTYYSDSFNLTVDTPSTTTPAITDLTAASWTGSSSADKISQASHATLPHTTSDSTPALKGTAGSLAALNVYDGTSLLGYTVADAAGNWTFQIQDYQQRTNGTHSFTVKDIGNSLTSSAYALVIDSTAPTQIITITSLSADTGSSSTDFITATQNQTISATLSAPLMPSQTLWGSLDGGLSWTNITSSVNSTSISWTNQNLRTGLADSQQYVPWSVQFKVTDTNNQTGPIASNDYQLIQSSGVPVISTMAQSSSSSVTTNYSYPVFTGTADANTLVDIYLGTTKIGTAPVDGAGNWIFSSKDLIVNGSYDVKVLERDPLTGYGISPVVESVHKTLIINTGLPLLTLNSVSDSGLYSSDGITKIDVPSVRVNFASIGFTPTTGDTITIYQGSTSVGSKTVSNADDFSVNKFVDITTSTLGSDADITLKATVVHSATNFDSNQLTFKLDKTAPLFSSAVVDGTKLTVAYSESVGMDPTVPDISQFSVVFGSTANTITDLAYDPLAKKIILTLATAATSSTTNVKLSYTLGTGNKVIDIAGNASASFSNQSVTNSTDTTAPTLSSIALQVPASSPTNASSVTFRATFVDASGGVANVDPTDFVATLSAGATGTPSIKSVTQVSGLVFDVLIEDPLIASANGTLTLKLNTTSNGMDIVDLSSSSNPMVNNTSTAGSVVLDHLAPALTVALTSDTTDGVTGDNTDKKSSNPALNVSTLEAGATRTYSVDGNAPVSNYVQPTAAGIHTVVVKDVDGAGNAATLSTTFTLDAVAPVLSSAKVVGNSMVLSYTENGVGMSSVRPATADYNIVVNNGAAVHPTVVTVNPGGNSVTLTLASSVSSGDTVTLSYIPATNKIQDIAGNLALSLTNTAVTVNTVTAPTVNLANDTTDGVGVDATDVKSSDATLLISTAGNNIDRTYSVDGASASASYSPPTDQGVHTVTVIDTNHAISADTSNTSLTFTLDSLPPTLSTNTVSGTSLVLNYFEDGVGFSSVAPAKEDYQVVVNGTAATLASAALDQANSKVTLTLTNAVISSDVVDVSYIPGAHKVQDIAGNLAASLTHQSVNNVTPTNLSVNSPVVSESSPYVIFEATLTNSSSADVVFTPSLQGISATVGTDTGDAIEYYNGTAWVPASSGVTIVAGATQVLLRAQIKNDPLLEGTETFKLITGAIAGQVINTTGTEGTSSIKDDGSTANVFLADNVNGNASTGIADNDNPVISVSSVTVSEAQAYATVSISLSNPSLSSITFTPTMTGGAGVGQATIGVDTGASLEYFNAGTSTWSSASGGVTIPAGKLGAQMRVSLVHDNNFSEGVETLAVSTGSISSGVSNTVGATGIVSILDVTALRDPEITNVLETAPPDPTPYDLLTATTAQVVTLTGEPGCTVNLYRLDDTTSMPVLLNVPSFTTAEVTGVSSSTYTLDFGTNNLGSGNYEVKLSKNGYFSSYSNAFTIDSTPGLYDIVGQRTIVQVTPTNSVTNGAVGGMDQNRSATYFDGTDWFDSDGQKIRFSTQLVTTFDKTAPPDDQVEVMTSAAGSTLSLHTQTGAYTYDPSDTAIANGAVETFSLFASDGAKGSSLVLSFDPLDSLDRDGIPARVETNLGSLSNVGGSGSGDLNNDGVLDANQNSVTTLAWTTVDQFNAAIAGTLTDIRPVISLQVEQSTNGTTVDSSAQLSDVKILAPTSSVTGGSKPANATWDTLQFNVESVQSMGLLDADPSRPGTQIRLLIDVSRAGVASGTFAAYKKYVNAAAINAGGVVDLDGHAVTTPGWYDFTQRVAGGDGARFITSNGIITGIELTITDNAFGDDDPTVGKIFDPGVPVGVTSPAPPPPPVVYIPVPGVPTVNSLVTHNLHPTITGSANLRSGETLTVSVNGATYANVPVTNGLWSLDTLTAMPNSGELSPFANGVSYSVTATAINTAGDRVNDLTNGELVIDTQAPSLPTVVSQVTNNTHPVLTGGAVLLSGEKLAISVNGATFENVQVVDGNWSLNTLDAVPTAGTLGEFKNGQVYSIEAVATDLAANSSMDVTSNELLIDTTPPSAPTVISQLTNNTHPAVTGGALLLPGETLTITVNGASYANVPVVAGQWTVNTVSAIPTMGTLAAFVDGQSYEVVAVVKDAAGNRTLDLTENELKIDTTPPAVPTVDFQVCHSKLPLISGTAKLMPGELLNVTVNGATYQNVPVVDGKWSLSTSVAVPGSGVLKPFLDGQKYEVTAVASDLAMNSSSDLTTNELTMDIPQVLSVYAVNLPNSDRWLSANTVDVHQFALNHSGGKAELSFFAVDRPVPNSMALVAWQNALTGDYVYLPSNVSLPYACYVKNSETSLGYVVSPGKGAFDVHLYLNTDGMTQVMGETQATQLGLLGHGYVDLGAIFASLSPDGNQSINLVGQIVGV